MSSIYGIQTGRPSVVKYLKYQDKSYDIATNYFFHVRLGSSVFFKRQIPCVKND